MKATKRKSKELDRHQRADAYATARLPVVQAYLRGDRAAAMKLLNDAIKVPRVCARIIGMEKVR